MRIRINVAGGAGSRQLLIAVVLMGSLAAPACDGGEEPVTGGRAETEARARTLVEGPSFTTAERARELRLARSLVTILSTKADADDPSECGFFTTSYLRSTTGMSAARAREACEQQVAAGDDRVRLLRIERLVLKREPRDAVAAQIQYVEDINGVAARTILLLRRRKGPYRVYGAAAAPQPPRR